MSDRTGVEWRGEPLAYGTIVSAPSHGVVAMVLTGMEDARVESWYRLSRGEHAILVIEPGPRKVGRHADGREQLMWMLPYDKESIRWLVLEDGS